MRDFKIRQGMDRVATYHALIACHKKNVNFQILGQPEFMGTDRGSFGAMDIK